MVSDWFPLFVGVHPPYCRSTVGVRRRRIVRVEATIGRRDPCYWAAVRPPSTKMICPVTKFDAGAAR